MLIDSHDGNLIDRESLVVWAARKTHLNTKFDIPTPGILGSATRFGQSLPFFCFLAIVLAFLPSATSAQEKLGVHSQILPGKYVLTFEQSREGAMDGVSSSVKTGGPAFLDPMSELVVLDITAESPANGGQILHLKYRRIKVGTNYPSFDTDSPNFDDSLGYNRFLNVPFDVTLNEKISTIDVGSMDALWDNFRNSFTPKEEADPMLPSLKAKYGQSPVKGLFVMMSRELPSTPIAIGGTWHDSFSMTPNAMIGPVTIDETLTFNHIERTNDRSTAIIDLKSSLSKSVSEDSLKRFDLKKASYDVVDTGQIRRDLDSGMLLSREVDGNVVLHAEAADEAGKEDDHNLTVHLKASLTLAPGSYVAATQP